MKVGVPFNPYRVFQGAFAPYWLLEHRGISAGAKLCYIRLLGFAGKDARCYPSLETLGFSLGVSDRQARDYVKELERRGLIVIEQRGLRKTNVYLFVWTAELERLMSAVPDRSADPDEFENERPPGSPPDRNKCSGQNRNSGSPPDRNTRSALDRKYSAGPIGINSLGRNSLESSSSSKPMEPAKTKRKRYSVSTKAEPEVAVKPLNEVAENIRDWATDRSFQRLRSDRQLGYPDDEHLELWSRILKQRGVTGSQNIFTVLDAAVAAATRSGEWRNWSFLTLQVQLATERFRTVSPGPAITEVFAYDLPEENPSCHWAKAKENIRIRIGEVPFANWFERTRQVEQQDGRVTVAVPDDCSRLFIETEYGNLTKSVLAELGIDQIEMTVARG